MKQGGWRETDDGGWYGVVKGGKIGLYGRIQVMANLHITIQVIYGGRCNTHTPGWPNTGPKKKLN